MPMPCYLTVEGRNQGKIEGATKVQGHEGKILVQAVDHVIEIPKSPQTGLPTGKRVHGAMTVAKEIDKSSPKLFQALTSGEQLKSVLLEFYRISPKGTEEKYYTSEAGERHPDQHEVMDTELPRPEQPADRPYGRPRFHL